MPELCIPGGDVYPYTLGGTLNLLEYNYVNVVNWTEVSVTAAECAPVFGAFFERHKSSDYEGFFF